MKLQIKYIGSMKRPTNLHPLYSSLVIGILISHTLVPTIAIQQVLRLHVHIILSIL
jgi:hypothetical protein